jgi:anoctamin-10
MNNMPLDFCTLVRFTILTKFARNSNLHTRSFIHLDEPFIVMVIKSNQATVKQEAEASGLTKQLELGYADLFSLEPCDKLFRPLRLKRKGKDSLDIFF